MFILLLAAASALTARPAQDATIPVEVYLLLKGIEEVRAAPVGRGVVMTVAERDAPRDPKRRSLYRWSQQDGLRRLAPAFQQAWRPRWSPDAARVGFLAVHPPETAPGPGPRSQLWVIEPRRPGDPVLLLSVSGAVQDFAWAGDDTVIALTGAGGATATAGTALSDSAGLWKVPVNGGRAELLWSGPEALSELVASPDGRSLVVVRGPYTSDPEGHRETDLWVHSLDGGEPRRLTRRPGPERQPTWSPDGTEVSFQAPQQPDRPNSQTELFSVPAAGGDPRQLTAAFDRTVLDHLWTPDGRLIFRAALGTHTHLFAIEASGAIAPLTRGPLSYGAFSYRPEDSSLVAVREGAQEPQELWSITEGAPDQLTRMNERVGRWRTPRQEVIRWTAPDGLVVEGLLVYPRDYSEGERYPLLVDPAGGWGRRATDALQHRRPYSLLAAHGYAVLAVNFRGSIGYGESFATANRRDLGGGQLPDITSGIAHLSRLGIADTRRLGIIGDRYRDEIEELELAGGVRFRAAAILAKSTDRGWGHQVASDRIASQVPLLIVDESSGSDFDTFFRLLRWFDRFLKFDSADRVAFRLPGEPSFGPGDWSLRVHEVNPLTDVFTLQPGGSRFLTVAVAFRHADSGGGPGSRSVVKLDLEDAVVLDSFEAGQIPLAGTVTRFFGYHTLLLPLGSLALTPGIPGGTSELALDLAFPIADAVGEFLLRVQGFEPVRIFVPPAGT